MPHGRLLTCLLACFILAVASPAQARRDISFSPAAIPDDGAVALAVRDGLPDEGAFAAIDRAAQGALRRAVAATGWTAARGTVLNLPGVAGYDQVLLVGIGTDPVDARLLEDVGGLVGQAGQATAAARIALLWPEAGLRAAGAHLAFGAELGQYALRAYRTPAPDAPVLGQGSLVLHVADPEASRRAFEREWRPVAEAVRFARDLVGHPANVIYPESFVERTREAFEGVDGVSIEVLDVDAMQSLGMNSILAVGQGSARPPRLLVVRYRGGDRDQPPLAFVGKGITFDTGGISIKPSNDLWKMKYDMSGAAAVVGAVLGLAKRGAQVNAVAVAALAENMPSGTAGRPGDVVRTMSGRTYEVMSTDAEGRMVLVDAIWFVQERDRPAVLVDVATLTGSQVVALGDEYAGLFSRDDALAAEIAAAGAASGEEVWRLPLHPSYAKDLESPIADLRNGGGRGAGAGLGAHFIGSWVQEGVAWAHLDIASMAWREDEPLPTVPAGATGWGVRLIDRLVRGREARPQSGIAGSGRGSKLGQSTRSGAESALSH